MIKETLLDRIGSIGSFEPMPTGTTPAECAAAYQRIIADLVTGPGIDLIHMGMGPDGHTASLFPGADSLDAGPGDLVVATEDPARRNPHPRLTLTLPAINSARTAVFTVAGATNAAAVAALSAGRTPGGPGPCRAPRSGWSTTPPAATPPRLAPMLSDRDLLHMPLADLTALARGVRDEAHGRRITYSPKVFIPLTMLCRDRCGYCTFAKAPARLTSPYLTPDEVLADRPRRSRGRLPRGALHPGRAARAALPRCAATGWPARLRVDGGLPRRDVPTRPGGDRPAPPRQRRRPLRRRAGRAAPSLGQPGDDARVAGRGPGGAPRRARQGAGPPRWPRWRPPASWPSPSRPGSSSASATTGRASWPRLQAIAGLARPPRPRAGGHRPELPAQAGHGHGQGRAVPARGPAVGHRGGAPGAAARRPRAGAAQPLRRPGAAAPTPASTTGAASRPSRPTT